MLFDGITPLRRVSVTADKAQAALDTAPPGTAIIVTGITNASLSFKTSGTPTAPIWLIGDGAQVAAVSSWGLSNVVIANFRTVGGFHGILAGEGENVLIVNNVVSGAIDDGIKCTRFRNVEVIGNTVSDCNGDGVDFVLVTDGLISHNEVFNVRSQGAAVFAKAGSERVAIRFCAVHDIPNGDGISLGGQGSTHDITTWELKDGAIEFNDIWNIAQNPIITKGALGGVVKGNRLRAGTKEIRIADGRTTSAGTILHTRGVEITGNLCLGKPTPSFKDGFCTALVHGNPTSGAWDYKTGPSAIPRFTLTPEEDPAVIAELQAQIADLLAQLAAKNRALESAARSLEQAIAERDSVRAENAAAIAVVGNLVSAHDAAHVFMADR